MKLCVIPARGGSKRIARKNIRAFAGKPIIAWSIAAARESGLFYRVVVSTEDEEIAEVGRHWGAEVPFRRPAELADDYTGTNAVVKHAIEWHNAHEMRVEYACCIYATAPFVRARYLIEGYERLVASGKSFVFSVARYPHPVQRAVRVNARGEVEAMYAEYAATRSQDLEPAYHDAGQFYWGTAEAFRSDRPLFSSGASPVIVPSYLVQDIDTEEDWLRAEWMFNAMQAQKQADET